MKSLLNFLTNRHINKKKGFTLIEVIIVLAVFAILMAALFPKIARIIEDSKITRAKTEVDNIGTSINTFNSHTTLWPAGEGTAEGGKSYNFVEFLISGFEGEGPASGADVLATVPGIIDANAGWSGGAATTDYFDNHLRLNNPMNGRSYDKTTSGFTGANENRYYPLAGLGTDSGTFVNRINEIRYHWKGPYIELITFDPWGRRYINNIKSAWSTGGGNYLVSLIASGGSDNIISTDGNVESDEFNIFQPKGDDITFIIRRRKGNI